MSHLLTLPFHFSRFTILMCNVVHLHGIMDIFWTLFWEFSGHLSLNTITAIAENHKSCDPNDSFGGQ